MTLGDPQTGCVAEINISTKGSDYKGGHGNNDANLTGRTYPELMITPQQKEQSVGSGLNTIKASPVATEDQSPLATKQRAKKKEQQ